MIQLIFDRFSQRPAIGSLTLLVVLLSSVSCTARRNPSTLRFQTDRQDQAPEVDLGLYKSPEDRPGDQDKQHHVVVAVSGGGHRAANFAFGVLLELEKLECGDALKEVDYFSTVSGGGFGVGAYLASLSDHLGKNANDDLNALRDNYRLEVASREPNARQEILLHQLQRGYERGAARAFINLRATFTSLDRGDFLEDSLDRHILGAKNRGSSMTLNELWIPKSSRSAVLLPAWVANSVVFQNGAIFPITPDILQKYRVSSYNHAKRKQPIQGLADDLETFGTLPVAVAMKASASFPGLLPATTLDVGGPDKKNPYLHLQDGGLADNLGLLSAFSLVSQLEKTGGTTSLILIDAFTGETEPFSRKLGSPKFYQSLWRSTKVSLDSWHTRYRTLFKALLPDQDPIFLGFSDAQQSTREKIMAIGTSLSISTGERDSLFTAAAEVVKKNKPALCQAFFPAGSPTG